MVVAVSINLVLPLAWLVSVLLGVSAALALSVSGLIAAPGAALVILLLRSEHGVFRSALDTSELRRLLKVGLPLVPHMLAFGFLLQGTRLAAAIDGSASSADVAQASYQMLFLGVGFAMVSGIHGIVSASIQKATPAHFDATVAKYARAYGFLGAGAAGCLLVTVLSPIRGAMAGMQAPSATDLFCMALIPAALCAYYFFSTLLVRVERTPVLAIVTVSAAALYLGASALHDWSVTGRLVAYAFTMLLLPVIVAPISAARSHLSGPTLRRVLVMLGLGFVPCLLCLALSM